MSDPSHPVRHIVVFKYKDGVPDDHIQQITDAFRALQQQIPGIRSFEHGVDVDVADGVVPLRCFAFRGGERDGGKGEDQEQELEDARYGVFFV